MGNAFVLRRIALSIVVATAGLLVACGDDDETMDAGGDVDQEQQVTTDDAVFERDPISLLNEEISVTVEVENVLTDHAFDIATTRQTAEQFIVVYAQDERFDVGEMVMVTGVLQPFNTENAEDDLGIDLDDEALRRYEGAYAIVADRVEADVNNASS